MGLPWDYLRKIFTERSWTAKVPNAVAYGICPGGGATQRGPGVQQKSAGSSGGAPVEVWGRSPQKLTSLPLKFSEFWLPNKYYFLDFE